MTVEGQRPFQPFGEIFRRVDRYVLESFEKLFRRLQAEGRIAPALDIPIVAKAFMVIADGMFWRRAVDPSFDAAAVMPVTLQLVSALLNPVPGQEVHNQAGA